MNLLQEKKHPLFSQLSLAKWVDLTPCSLFSQWFDLGLWFYIYDSTYFWHWNRVWRIYSNIWIFKYIGNKYLFGHTFVSIFIYKFIWTFVRIKLVCTNIFGHSFVSLWKLVKTFIQFSILIFIRAFICVKFLIQIYSDIHSCKFIDTNIIGYSLVF